MKVKSGRRSKSWWPEWMPSGEGIWVVVFAVALGVGGPVWAVWSNARGGETDQRKSVRRSLEGEATGGLSPVDSLQYENVRQAKVSERIQMSAQLAQAASLRLARERVQNRVPAHALALVQGVVVDGLRPPGVDGPLEGSSKSLALMASRDAWFVVRYTPGRFVVEVVSLPRAKSGEGTPMLVRVPDDPAIFGDAPGFYVRVEVPGSRSSELPLQDQMPPAFVDAITLVGAGWQINKLPVAGALPSPAGLN
jgi:hypothetical protein